MNLNNSKEISTSEEDKKFVSEAVKLVIGHTRVGFVPLCASVATLLKEKANLELENEYLKKHITELKQLHTQDNKILESSSYLSPIQNELDCHALSKISRDFDHIQVFKFKRKSIFKIYKPIKGCLCSNCNEQPSDLDALFPPLKKGDRVVVAGEMCGSVEYIGHVDHLHFPEVFIGLYLDEPVGDCDGTFHNKTYFKVSHHHGLFVSLFNICCIME